MWRSLAPWLICAFTFASPARADGPDPTGAPSESATRLAKELADPSAIVRAKAVGGLTLPLASDVREVLRSARWNESDKAVIAAIDGLLVARTRAPRDRVRAIIEPVAMCGNQEGPSYIDGDWNFLHELGSAVDEVLIAIAADPKEPPAVRASALAWLARFPSAAGRAYLEAQLRATDQGPVLAAGSAAAFMAAFYGLRRPWERSERQPWNSFWSSHFDDQGPYAAMFGAPRAADIVPHLVRRLGHPAYEVRRTAAWGLGFIDTPEATAALRAALKREKDGGVQTAIRDSLRLPTDAP